MTETQSPGQPLGQPLGLMSEAELEQYKLHRRFDRMGRLVGDTGMERLMGSYVMVIGLGGVGSWAAEGVVRAGVGEIAIVDFDEICVTNCNRQLQAMTGVVGQQKAEVLAERFRKINPQASITAHVKFYNQESSDELLGRKPDYVIDAIDNITAKCHLLHRCRKEGIPVVTATGSGGRLDPTQVVVRDLAETEVDPLARSIRKILRQQYDFPECGSFGIPAVFSAEPVIMPQELHYDGGKGFRCVCSNQGNELHTCENRNVIMGNAGFVTGAFGMACASVAVRHLLSGSATV
ncbi:MAG: tRNA threonylcarbamoyladenosine dehydratase [Bdellovibrionales bacterium GWB1_55_8]|nr:MAG: tRNA threonylcarbamoyladenosine dehydratase [Bdellovibrionales bacterium GWB1_55_8]